MSCFLLAGAALFVSGATTNADAPDSLVYSPALQANGRTAFIDLDGDGRSERISLREPHRRHYDRDHRPFQIQVNGQVFNDVWTDSNVPGIGEGQELSLQFRTLRPHGQSRYLFLGGPTGYEATAYKIYEWRGGKIRQTLRHSMLIDKIRNDGTVEEIVGWQWGSATIPWRLNRRGVFQKVPRAVYPFHAHKMDETPVRIFKPAPFHQAPRLSAAKFVVPQGAIIKFDGINAHHWLRARYGQKILWMAGQTADNSNEIFQWPRAG